MEKTDDKNKWRELWLDSINELTTLELQEKTWLRKIIISESPHWSFTEFICCYFDDLLYYEYPYFVKKGWISDKEYDTLKEWHNELEEYQTPKRYNGNDKIILKDKNWLRLMEKGIKTKQRLIDLVPDHEKKYLLGMESYAEYLRK